MRTIGNPKFEVETLEEQRKAKRYNPATVLIYNRKRMTLSCGNADDIHVFRSTQGPLLYVLSMNFSMDYAGLTEFDTRTGDQKSEVFFQNGEELAELIGGSIRDFAPMTVCKRMMEYLPD